MWSYLWPIFMVVLANIAYNIITKSTPAQANAFLTLTVTYLTGALISFILFFVCGKRQGILTELSKINWTAFALGFSIVALEAGYISVYRAGWKISAASLAANIMLACVLVFIGYLFYQESISLRQLIGIGVCIAGFVLISG